MRGIINKSGAGQFEMVISMVFFLGFVSFLFIALSPQDTTTLSNAVVTGLYNSFTKETSTNLSSMFLRTNQSQGQSCFTINLPSNLFIYNISKGNSFTETVGGQEVHSNLIGNNLDIVSNDSFFRIEISPEIKGSINSECVSVANYSLGSISERKVISYNSLEKMQEKYLTNYDDLKNELQVPPTFDFAIIARTLPIKMTPQHGIPSSVKVMANEHSLEVLRDNGTLTNENFDFKIW